MKKIFLIIATAFIFSAPSAQASTLAKAPNNLGLVGYWPMNEGRGTRAGDASGNGNHGTLTNGPTWGAGKLGYGLNFDGTNDYVGGTGVPVNGASAVSLSVWIKSTNTSSYIVSIPYNTGGFNGFDFRFATTLKAYLKTSNGGVDLDSGVSISDGSWHHSLATYDGVNFRIYIDGVLRNSAALTGTVVVQADNEFNFGRLGTYGAYFSGSLDDVRIYNRALTAAEVAKLYAAGQARNTTSNSNGLVGYWPFSECSGTRAGDLAGNSNYATLINGPTWGTSRLGCGLTFDGVNDYVDFGTSSTLRFTTGGTIAFWYKRLGNSPSTYQPIVQRLNASGQGYQVYSIDSSRNLGFYTDSSVVSTYTISDANWHYYIITNDGSTTRFYVDGTAYGSGAQTVAIGTGLTPTSTTFGNFGSNYLNGSLDDVRIYNRALSVAEASSLYASGVAGVDPGRTVVNSTQKTQLTNGLVGYWGFNGQDTTWSSSTAGTTRDISGNGNTGTLTNMSQRTSPVAGRVGQALRFNGTIDYVTVPNSASIGVTSSFALSAWVKGSAISDSDFFLHRLSSYGLNIGATLQGVASGKFGFIVLQSGVWKVVSSTTSPTNGIWYHVAGVYNGSTIKIYVNGVEEGSTAVTGSIDNAGTPLEFGAYSGAMPTFNYSGSLDEVRMYNRALSAAEVVQLYNLGK